MREIEPHVQGQCAVHVPEEGIVDYLAVCAAMRREVSRLGGDVRLGAEVRKIAPDRLSGGWILQTTTGDVRTGQLVNCAGLYADRISRMAGAQPTVRIVPFRGEYWKLRPERTHLVRHLIYPVPDPAFPFLGVHFTRMIHGGVEAGPNAVLALSREGYRWKNISPRDLASALSYVGLWRFLYRHRRMTAFEIRRSLSRRVFVSSLRKLVPEVDKDDLVPGQSGVRAQVVSRQGDIIQDFVLDRRPNAVHVLSAPSPAATASLAIADHIVAML
jgi:L-2-hydroxyglutarate oxidase